MDKFLRTLRHVLGYWDDVILRMNGGCVEAEIDGLRFAALEVPSELFGTVPLVTLLGRCRSCGVETTSQPFTSLAGLGKMLEKFEPTKIHRCVR